MSLSSDLLDQARHLANREPRRPRQASLRRAVSAAYYSLFHYLIERASSLIVSGGGPDREAERKAVSRAFQHKQMKTVSEAFAGAQRNPWKSLFRGPIPADLIQVASTFVDLQQARHEADYDLSRDFTRGEVLALITRAQGAVQAFRSIQTDSHARAYLLGLVVSTR